MKYYLDTEFNEFGGALLSLALVREDGKSLYVVYDPPESLGPWVAANVMPIMYSVPRSNAGGVDYYQASSLKTGAHLIAAFMAGDTDPTIITDWPDDIKYFCQAIITGPGEMIAVPGLKFQMQRVDAYPTTLHGAIQHNAWWDAMALRHLLAA